MVWYDTILRRGFRFVHNPRVAETLDVRDEGETSGMLPRNKGFTLVARFG